MFLQDFVNYLTKKTVDLFLYGLRMYSTLEIELKKKVKFINQYFIGNPKNKFITYDDNVHNTTVTLYYDYINETKNNTNVLICNEDFKRNNYNYKVSNISFIDIYFRLDNEKCFTINLKKPFNYYIVGNILNSSFFIYYLTNKYKELEYSILYNGVLLIFDHNMKMYEIKLTNILHSNFEIKIQENDYILTMGEFNVSITNSKPFI
jgi:hypothetical protein